MIVRKICKCRKRIISSLLLILMVCSSTLIWLKFLLFLSLSLSLYIYIYIYKLKRSIYCCYAFIEPHQQPYHPLISISLSLIFITFFFFLLIPKLLLHYLSITFSLSLYLPLFCLFLFSPFYCKSVILLNSMHSFPNSHTKKLFLSISHFFFQFLLDLFIYFIYLASLF